MTSTPGSLLGGRVAYAQPARGYRSGLEPVLLAAAVPARAGQLVLEAGSGAGAGLLCLATRVAGARGLGVEADPALAALAARNAAANGLEDRLRFDAARIEHAAEELAARVDHAMANPPWHDEAGTRPACAGRTQAKFAAPGLLDDWVAALARCLRPRGTLTLVVPAAQLHRVVLACAAAGIGAPRLLPLWPRAGRPAKLLIVHAARGGRGGAVVGPGLVLHDAGGFTAAAEAVLRRGEALAV